MLKTSLVRFACVALALQLGCGDDNGSDQLASDQDRDAATPQKTSKPSDKASGGRAAAAGSKATPTKDGQAGAAAVGGKGQPSGGKDAEDAGVGNDMDKVSKPGEYSGYGEKLYDGFVLSSEYVEVRDGTLLAVDLYRPKDKDGKAVDAKLPVLWMHTPYNRRYFTYAGTKGLSGEAYPGAAARLVDYGYVVAIADFRGLYASYGENIAYNRGEWVDAARLDAYDITELGVQLSIEGERLGLLLGYTAAFAPIAGTGEADTLHLALAHLTYAFLATERVRLRAEIGGHLAAAPLATFVAPGAGVSAAIGLAGPLGMEARAFGNIWPYTQLDARAGLTLSLGSVGLGAGVRALYLNDNGALGDVNEGDTSDAFWGPYFTLAFALH